MKLEDWNQTDRAALPKGASGNFPDYLETQYTEFLNDISGLQNDPLENKIKNLKPQIEALSNGILAAVRAYLEGHPDRAYNKFKSAISNIDGHLDIIANTGLDSPEDLRFYRIRISNKPEKYTREQIFHIPFESRHLVSLQRFSIPGLPCLYLGSSLFVCWEELGRPNFPHVYASQFRLKPGKGKFLNLIGYQDLLRVYIDNFRRSVPTNPAIPNLEDVIIAYIICWPIALACMTEVNHKESPFKPEYIIPQLLLQWLTQEKANLDGIRYLSTKIGSGNRHEISSNYVIPVKTLSNNGLCPNLKDLFEVTQVIGWDIAMTSGIRSRTVARSYDIDLAPEVRVKYELTSFGRFEEIFDDSDFQSLLP